MQSPILTKNVSNSLKGIAIILILISHLFGGVLSTRLFTPLGGVGVAMFLFLSGYGLNESYKIKGIEYFWKNKFSRILLPYIIWSILLIPISFLLYGEIYFLYRYWYLSYLFLWYTLFLISKRYLPQYTEYILLLTAICTFFLFTNIRAEQCLSFVSGVISSSRCKFLKYNLSKFVKIAIFLSLFGIAMLAIKQLHGVRILGEESLLMKICQLGIKLPIAISVIMLYSAYESKINFKNLLCIIGTISLEIYLVHMPLIEYSKYSTSKLFFTLMLIILIVYILNKLSRRLQYKFTNDL